MAKPKLSMSQIIGRSFLDPKVSMQDLERELHIKTLATRIDEGGYRARRQYLLRRLSDLDFTFWPSQWGQRWRREHREYS